MKFPINWAIISHPANWFIVLLMVLIAGFALDIIASYHASLAGNNAS
jgi:hypothetical protein